MPPAPDSRPFGRVRVSQRTQAAGQGGKLEGVPAESLLGVDARDHATEIGHAEVDGGVTGREVVHGGELLLCGSEAGLDRGDLAEPALFLGFLKSDEKIRLDLLQPGQLLRAGPQDRATDARFSELVPLIRANSGKVIPR